MLRRIQHDRVSGQKAPSAPAPPRRPHKSQQTSTFHRACERPLARSCGAGEWLVEKLGTRRLRSWRKLHIGVDASTGEIIAAVLTTKDVDDASEVGPLLEQVVLASFTAEGAYDQDSIYDAVTARDPEAAVILPPRSTAALSVAETDRADAARPSSSVHCREGANGVAECVRLQRPKLG